MRNCRPVHEHPARKRRKARSRWWAWFRCSLEGLPWGRAAATGSDFCFRCCFEPGFWCRYPSIASPFTRVGLWSNWSGAFAGCPKPSKGGLQPPSWCFGGQLWPSSLHDHRRDVCCPGVFGYGTSYVSQYDAASALHGRERRSPRRSRLGSLLGRPDGEATPDPLIAGMNVAFWDHIVQRIKWMNDDQMPEFCWNILFKLCLIGFAISSVFATLHIRLHHVKSNCWFHVPTKEANARHHFGCTGWPSSSGLCRRPSDWWSFNTLLWCSDCILFSGSAHWSLWSCLCNPSRNQA